MAFVDLEHESEDLFRAPVIKVGDAELTGPGLALYEKFFENAPTAKSSLYPSAHKAAIKEMMVWDEETFRPAVNQLIDRLVEKEEADNEEDDSKVLDEFFDTHMVSLEKKLETHTVGFSCERLSFADVVIYNDMCSVLHLYGAELKESTTPNLSEWFENMKTIVPKIEELDKKFDQACKAKGIGK